RRLNWSAISLVGQVSLRDAGIRWASVRGLKPTATVGASLREANPGQGCKKLGCAPVPPFSLILAADRQVSANVGHAMKHILQIVGILITLAKIAEPLPVPAQAAPAPAPVPAPAPAATPPTDGPRI